MMELLEFDLELFLAQADTPGLVGLLRSSDCLLLTTGSRVVGLLREAGEK